jgi:hypothetical protein
VRECCRKKLIPKSCLPGRAAYAIRFVIGGLITTATGLVARKFGPVVGGLFLAYPAIFPPLRPTGLGISRKFPAMDRAHGNNDRVVGSGSLDLERQAAQESVLRPKE